MNNTVIVRGGGDLATAVIQKLHRTGFKVLVLEVKEPRFVRATVSLANAIYDGEMTVEDITAVRIDGLNEIEDAFKRGVVPILIDKYGESIKTLKPLAVIDCIIAKKNLGTNRSMAPITIALGPGFVAGEDVDLVIETNRGHDLGRLIFEGSAQEDTGIPGNIEGYSTKRLLRSPTKGKIIFDRSIGDTVKKGERIGTVEDVPVVSQIDGMIRGLIHDGLLVREKDKIGDVDPRVCIDNIHTISDKARNIAGGVLEGLMILRRRLD